MPDDKKTEQAINLFRFIKEFARLNQKPVQNLDSYVDTFWLDEIPLREAGCFCAAWLPLDDFETKPMPESWVSIKRPRRQDPPRVPRGIEPWVNLEQWQDSLIEMPELFARIIDPGTDADGEEEPEWLELSDFPQIRQAWDSYVETKWWAWAERDRLDTKIEECYVRLFTMHRNQLAIGEQYEFLLAAGCLHWRTPGGESVKRHLLVLPVSIAFDSVSAVVSIVSAGSTPQVALETDMLQQGDQPELDITNEAEVRCASLADCLFRQDAKTLLTGWVQGLHEGEGVFIDVLEKPVGQSSDRPVVSYSPALIVRKRTQRTLIQACDTAIMQLGEEGAEVPTVLRKLTGELGVDKEYDHDQHSRSGDDEVYFPLPCNDEQRRILQTLQRQTGVLVQGPPGTGKSLTISNLICHLLATGQRILVTSQKAPALRVLKDKLPAEIANLCVMVLGEGADEQHELQKSVSEVASRHAVYSAPATKKKIEELKVDLHRARSAEATALSQLCLLRRKEVADHSPQFGTYSGSLSSIAARLRSEEERYSWFRDRPPRGQSLLTNRAPALPFDPSRATRLLTLLRESNEDMEQRCSMRLVLLKDVPDAAIFKALVDSEKAARLSLSERKHHLAHPFRRRLTERSDADLDSLCQEVSAILSALQAFMNCHDGWSDNATRQVLQGDVATWQTLSTASTKLLTGIDGKPAELADVEVRGLGDRSFRMVLQDARELQSHLTAGKGLGIGIFRPAVVKQRLYLVKEVTIDGKPCRDTIVCFELIRWLEYMEAIRKLKEQWSPVVAEPPDLPSNQLISRYQQFYDQLASILRLGDRVRELSQEFSYPGAPSPVSWHDPEAVRALREHLRALQAERAHNVARSALAEVEGEVWKASSLRDSAPENGRLLCAVQNRDIQAYARNISELGALWHWRERMEEKKKLTSSLGMSLLQLRNDLLKSFADEAWDERLQELPGAWNWVCAEKWLAEMMDPDAEKELVTTVRRRRQEVTNKLSQLAAELAWEHCLTSLTEEGYQGLMAWKKAVDRIGKGTGKHAEHFRSIARKGLEDCRTAIRAWVMPFYKVLDSAPIAPQVFDVAIIDEASQSGVEACLLSYLAKRVIVVGDDQQIRPDRVGILQTDVFQLQKRYLANISNNAIFSDTDSLFSIAEVRFGSPIRLREHFRCMPEIIGFSNRLCYQDQPLIPLRQYGKKRIEPVLVPHYVSDAFQAGRKGINKPEAEALVAEVVKCSGDPAYKGKTFGVISLLNTTDQDHYIEQLLIKRLGTDEYERRDIRCGDAYDFQGDERDVIFLTMVSAISADSRVGALANNPAKRRFNVAMSRAKDQVHLFHSVSESDLSPSCYRRQLLSYMYNPVDVNGVLPEGISNIGELRVLARGPSRAPGTQPDPFDSWFEVDVFLDIVEQGYQVFPQYEQMGYRIDLVVLGGTHMLAVECDGDVWHGAERYEHDLHRQRELERCGWVFMRIRGSSYYRDPAAALAPLWEMLVKAEEMEAPEADRSELTNVPAPESTAPDDDDSDLDVDGEPDGFTPPVGGDEDEAPHGGGDNDDGERVPPLVHAPTRSIPPKPALRLRSQDAKPTGPIQGVEDLMKLTNRQLGAIICDMLEERPKYTAKKDDITKLVCQHVEVITRGEPRRMLDRKIMWALKRLQEDGLIEVYTATNVRIRLLNPSRQRRLL